MVKLKFIVVSDARMTTMAFDTRARANVLHASVKVGVRAQNHAVRSLMRFDDSHDGPLLSKRISKPYPDSELLES